MGRSRAAPSAVVRVPARPFRLAPNARHVRPPSTLRKTPFCRVDRYRVRGRRGSRTIADRSRAGAGPADRQLVPPSRVTRTPSSPTAQTVPARAGSTVSDQLPSARLARSSPRPCSAARRRELLRTCLWCTGFPSPRHRSPSCPRVLGRMACHVALASRERKATVFSSPRVMAYTFPLSAGSTAIEYTHPSESAYSRLRPGAGRSPDWRHVRPASVLFSTPSFVPRRGSSHGVVRR